jgi:hypothetical protein
MKTKCAKQQDRTRQNKTEQGRTRQNKNAEQKFEKKKRREQRSPLLSDTKKNIH